MEAALGAPWQHVPERYEPWKTVHGRLRKWTMDEAWERVLAHVIAKDDAASECGGLISVDSTVV